MSILQTNNSFLMLVKSSFKSFNDLRVVDKSRVTLLYFYDRSLIYYFLLNHQKTNLVRE